MSRGGWLALGAAIYLGIGVYRTQRGGEPLWHAPLWPAGLLLR